MRTVFLRARSSAAGRVDSLYPGVRLLVRRATQSRENPSEGGARALPRRRRPAQPHRLDATHGPLRYSTSPVNTAGLQPAAVPPYSGWVISPVPARLTCRNSKFSAS